MLKFYAYKGCDGCRKARKWLNEHEIAFQELAIRETPPSTAELTQMLAYQGNLRALFNTSGMDYRQLGLKDKLPQMSETDALKLLQSNGNLVKRPFLIGKNTGLVGFKPESWKQALVK